MDALAGCTPEFASCGAHSLAEVYANLTRMPGRDRTTGPEAMLFVDQLRQMLRVITLEVHEYAAVLGASAQRGIVGGAIYDALLAQCALKAEAEVIYTWNIKDFARCGPEVARRLRTP